MSGGGVGGITVRITAVRHGVAHEGGSRRTVEVADVMLGVSGCVGDLQVMPGRLDLLAATQHMKVRFGHCRELAPERTHLVAIYLRRTGDELLRRRHVARSTLVHVDPAPRPAPHDRARGAGMVEVDVRQKQRLHVVKGEST